MISAAGICSHRRNGSWYFGPQDHPDIDAIVASASKMDIFNVYVDSPDHEASAQKYLVRRAHISMGYELQRFCQEVRQSRLQ
jgi:hypothetical protein